MAQKTQFIRDLKEGSNVSTSFLIKYSAVATGKTGKPYLNLILLDSSGEVEARVWEGVTEIMSHAVKDNFVWVDGRCQQYQGRKQIVIQRLQLLREDEVNVRDYLEEGKLDIEGLYETLLGFVKSMKDPHYRALAESVLIQDEDIVSRVKRAPAAKSLHHAYKGGLLEHMVSIAGILDGLAKHYGKFVDRDLLLIGCFFHDLGKIWELSYDRLTEYTTEGQLIGHLVMGVELIEAKTQKISVFPTEKKLLAKHVVLAHHGRLEYGSPKEPMCLEAMIVHMVDDLDSKVNAIRLFTEKDLQPGRWTQLNKQYGRYFYKPEWAMAPVDATGGQAAEME